MGCCLSAGKVTAPPVAADKSPPPIEEETVKEVVVQSVSVSVPVSVPDPDPDPIPVPDIVPAVPAVSDSEADHLPPPTVPTPEISHSKSDICSVSHSFSTATTATAASILEDDGLSKPHRPPPPSSTSRRNMSDRVSRSPGGRHSPQGKLRPRLVRERLASQPNPTHNRRNVDSGPLPRSGLQEGPRRRSRSPATRGPSSARRSPMKKREGAPEKDGAEARKKEEVKVAVEVKKEEDVAVKDPDVSMECFIFL